MVGIYFEILDIKYNLSIAKCMEQFNTEIKANRGKKMNTVHCWLTE
jgi:hypothetical protein